MNHVFDVGSCGVEGGEGPTPARARGSSVGFRRVGVLSGGDERVVWFWHTSIALLLCCCRACAWPGGRIRGLRAR